MNAEPSDTPGRPTRVRWVIFALACAVSWLLYLHRYAWSVVKPALRAENPEWTDTQVGWLDSAFSISYALGQVPGGLAGDVYGPRTIMAGFLLLWSATIAGLAWTGGFARIFFVRSLFGLAQAGTYPLLSKMTRIWFPLSIRTTVQGVVASMGRIGAAFAPLIIAYFLMGVLGLGWRTALLVITIPGIVLAILFWLLVRNSPREHPLVNESERDLIEAGTPPPAPNQPVVLLLNFWSVGNLGMLLLYAFASTFQDQLYVNWIPSFLMEGRGMDAREMGLFTPLPVLGGAIGGILGGILNDYLLRVWGNRRWARSWVAFTGKFVAAGMVFLAVQVDDGRLAMVILLLARVFGDWSLPTQWGATTDMGGRAAATVFALVNTVGALGGFVAGPILGYLKQEYSWAGLFYGVAFMCLLSALTWLFINCTRRVVAD